MTLKVFCILDTIYVSTN